MAQIGKKLLIGAVIAVPLATIVAGGLLVYFRLDLRTAPFYQVSFDRERWRNAYHGKTKAESAVTQDRCIRGAMYGDLKNRFLRPGASRTRVFKLIGKPDFGSTGTHKGTTCRRWSLGFCSGYKIDPDSLNVCFDKGGIVRHVFRLEH